MFALITTPILMAGVLVLAYRGFKAHKNGDEAGQNIFLKSCMLLAFLQFAESFADWLSWLPGYSLVKLLLVSAIVFPTETTQRMLYTDRLAAWISSAESRAISHGSALRASVSATVLRRATALCHWLVTETDCVVFVSDEELSTLTDITGSVTQRVKAENTRRLRASLPTSLSGAVSTFAAAPPAAPVAAEPVAAPAQAPLSLVLTPDAANVTRRAASRSSGSSLPSSLSPTAAPTAAAAPIAVLAPAAAPSADSTAVAARPFDAITEEDAATDADADDAENNAPVAVVQIVAPVRAAAPVKTPRLAGVAAATGAGAAGGLGAGNAVLRARRARVSMM
jgi:hypothetical protein